MPIYEYVARDAQECFFATCGGKFEEFQTLDDAPLAECPVCGAACRRLISLPAIKTHDREKSGVLKAQNLERHGFTQYKKAGDGVWEKTAGEGPQHLHRSDKLC